MILLAGKWVLWALVVTHGPLDDGRVKGIFNTEQDCLTAAANIADGDKECWPYVDQD